MVKIQSVLGGISPSQYFASEGQYLGAIGVDPDLPISSSDIRTSGALVPSVYEKFSGANVTASVVNIITVPKTTNVYVVLTNGRLISYNSSLASETLIGTVTGGVAKGAWYYNNYIYITTGTDVSRYGPLDGVAALVDGVWTGATLGSLTATVNTTYPALTGMTIPNHWGMAHGDGASYFLDFKNGQGLVHKIKTTKVTAEGDTNSGSAYNVLDLPFGFYPTCICSFSTDIAVLAIQTTGATINQGRAALFLWDPTNTDTFYRGPIYLADPIATGITTINGVLYIVSGNAQNGWRISQYAGGDAVNDIQYMEEGQPPFAGAMDAIGSRIVLGTYTTYPSTSASVIALGSKNTNLPKGLHNIIKSTSAGTNPNVTAVRYIQQASNIIPQCVVAWADDSAYGIDKRSTTATYSSVWRSEMIQVGRKFKIQRLRIPLGQAVSTNTALTVKIYVDDGSSSQTLTTINNTNFSGRRYVHYKDTELKSLGGLNNFFIEFTWAGTSVLPVLLPIEVQLDRYDDEP